MTSSEYVITFVIKTCVNNLDCHKNVRVRTVCYCLMYLLYTHLIFVERFLISIRKNFNCSITVTHIRYTKICGLMHYIVKTQPCTRGKRIRTILNTLSGL